MFSNQSITTLNQLAFAYNYYSKAGWDSENSAAKEGGNYITMCSLNVNCLTRILEVIAEGLKTGNKNADIACLLFDKLYKDGFKNNLEGKEALQRHFAELLSAEQIEKLKSGESLKDCLNSSSKVIMKPQINS